RARPIRPVVSWTCRNDITTRKGRSQTYPGGPAKRPAKKPKPSCHPQSRAVRSAPIERLVGGARLVARPPVPTVVGMQRRRLRLPRKSAVDEELTHDLLLGLADYSLRPEAARRCRPCSSRPVVLATARLARQRGWILAPTGPSYTPAIVRVVHPGVSVRVTE